MNAVQPSGSLSLKDKLAYGLFWSWNVIFVAFMVLGFAPRMLPEMIDSVRTGLIPFNFLLYALVLSLIPLAAVVLGLTALRREPERLFGLGYVVEGPLMLIFDHRLIDGVAASKVMMHLSDILRHPAREFGEEGEAR